MTWFKMDDQFYRHAKVRRLGKDRIAAVGLWALAGTWAAENLTDGFVPAEQVEAWDPKAKYAARLVAVGLWETAEHVGESGYRFHDWWAYQPTSEAVEAKREEWRERKARLRKKAQDHVSQRDTLRDTTRESSESPSRSLDPPVPVPVSGTSRGERPVGRRASQDQRPPERCPRHGNDLDPPPCGQCADARRAVETWDRQHQLDERLTIRACPDCDGEGQRLIPGRRIPMSPYVRCDHQRERAAAT